jgi:hypothetical protein
MESLGPALRHRVDIRVRLEEYSSGQPASRVILAHSADASDLSAAPLILVHVPERWTGPAESLEESLRGAIDDTGRVRPVLLVGEQPIIGDPFRQKLKTSGIGGIGQLLGGEGTRKGAVLATGEWLEFDFVAPDGHKETVIREVFDIVGKARRASGKTLTADDVRARTSAETLPTVGEAAYSLLFTTGRIDAEHFRDAVRETAASGRRLSSPATPSSPVWADPTVL